MITLALSVSKLRGEAVKNYTYGQDVLDSVHVLATKDQPIVNIAIATINESVHNAKGLRTML